MNLLYLAHRVPYPPDRGDRIRTYHVLRFLARHATVHLACLTDETPDPAAAAALRGLCAQVRIEPLDPCLRWVRALRSVLAGGTVTEGAFRSPALERALDDWGRDTSFDAVWITSSGLTPYLDLPSLRDVPAHVDLIDVDSAKWETLGRTGRGPRAAIHRLEARRLRRTEAALAERAAALYVVSPAEADLYHAFRDTDRLHVLRNGVDLETFRPAEDDARDPAVAEAVSNAARAAPPVCVFVGVLDYAPNIDGIAWFAREVWPLVRARRPDAVLEIVGRHPVPEVTALGTLPGVAVVGSVPDVRPHLWHARAAVVPLRIARGVQNKVLEALACGTPVVTSPLTLQGLQAEPGRDLLTASSPQEWSAAVLRLFEDEALAGELRRSGRAYVERHHRWDRCLEPLHDRLDLPHASLRPVVPAEAAP